MKVVANSIELSFRRGRAAFNRGEPNIMNDWTDEEWRGTCNEGQAFWLGWMLERGLGIIEEFKQRDLANALKNWAEHGGPLPPEYRI